jgi:hypothetical protein
MKGGESDADLLLRIDELKALIGGEDRKFKLALWFFAVGLVTGTVGLMKGDVWAFLGAIPLVFGVGRFANAAIKMNCYNGILEEKQAVHQDRRDRERDRQQGRRNGAKRDSELRHEIDKLKASIDGEDNEAWLAVWCSAVGVALTGLGYFTEGTGWVFLGVILLFFGILGYFFGQRKSRNFDRAQLRVKQAVLIDRH